MFRRSYAYADGTAGSRSRVMGSGLVTAARVVKAIGAIVAGIIVLGIVLKVLDANASNDLVGAVVDAGSWLVGPFKGLFSIGDADLRVAVNWGLAALVYFALSRLIARLMLRR
jgi:hypothetical protein